jgi:undecaprenyl-diphosphatase
VSVDVATPSERVRGAPSDVLRLAVALATLLLVTVVGALFDETVAGFVADLLRGLGAIDDWFWQALATLALVGGIGLAAAGVVVAVLRRAWDLLGAALLAGLVAAGATALITSFAGDDGGSVTSIDPVAAVGRGGSWPVGALAAVVGVVAAVSPWLGRPWRRAAWAVAAAVALIHFVTAPVSFGTGIALAAGWAAGAAVTVLLGAPSHRPTSAAVEAGLAAVGSPLASLKVASVDARGSTPYFGTAVDGTPLFVKVLGNDERSADLLFRAYRRVQPRDLGDEKAFSSLRRAVEHEALLALAARDIGVRTPRLVAFATAEPGGYVLAYEAIAGRSLDRVEADEMTDAMLDAVWDQLALLRAHRIAHRDLRLANVFLADDGAAWIIDFGFSELAASPLLMATDLAELLASSVTKVGLERGLAAARRAVGDAELRAAAERLRLPLLSGATRTAMKASPGLLDSVASGARGA